MKIRSVSFVGRIVPALIAALAFVVVPDVARTADANLRPKNIILMIADGTGTNTIAATGHVHRKARQADFRRRCVDQDLCLDLPVADRRDPERRSARPRPRPRRDLRPRQELGHDARHDDDGAQPRPFCRLCLDQAHSPGLREYDCIHRHRTQDLQQRRQCRRQREAHDDLRRACAARGQRPLVS